MLTGLREELSREGLSPYDIVLPGEVNAVTPLEGALRLRVEDEGSDGSYVLETVDYGRGYVLGRASDEAGARRLVLEYVRRPLPPVRTLTRSEADGLSIEQTVPLVYLRDRAVAARADGLRTELPIDLPLDRVGALDGVHLYPLGTPFEMRSLTPASLRAENDVPQFLTRAAIPVVAFIQPGWFGRAGGGLRLTIDLPGQGIRDLVADGLLQRIRIVDDRR